MDEATRRDYAFRAGYLYSAICDAIRDLETLKRSPRARAVATRLRDRLAYCRLDPDGTSYDAARRGEGGA